MKQTRRFYSGIASLRRDRRQQGFILITVLLTVVLLTGLLLGFNRQTREHLAEVDEQVQGSRALQAARSGVNFVIAWLRETPSELTAERLTERFNSDKSIQVGPAQCRLQVSAENGKFNVNALVDARGKVSRPAVDQFLHLIDIMNQTSQKQATLSSQLAAEPLGYGLAPALIDWIDPDDETTLLDFVSHDNSGAESAFYRGQRLPYRCTNRPFQTLQELLLVKGIQPQRWRSKAKVPGWENLLTVYGEGRIDLNQAPALVLQSLSEQVDPAQIQLILKRRAIKPFESVGELREAAGVDEAVASRLAQRVVVNPDKRYYRVVCEARTGDVAQSVEAILEYHRNQDKVRTLEYRELPLKLNHDE